MRRLCGKPRAGHARMRPMRSCSAAIAPVARGLARPHGRRRHRCWPARSCSAAARGLRDRRPHRAPPAEPARGAARRRARHPRAAAAGAPAVAAAEQRLPALVSADPRRCSGATPATRLDRCTRWQPPRPRRASARRAALADTRLRARPLPAGAGRASRPASPLLMRPARRSCPGTNGRWRRGYQSRCGRRWSRTGQRFVVQPGRAAEGRLAPSNSASIWPPTASHSMWSPRRSGGLDANCPGAAMLGVGAVAVALAVAACQWLRAPARRAPARRGTAAPGPGGAPEHPGRTGGRHGA